MKFRSALILSLVSIIGLVVSSLYKKSVIIQNPTNTKNATVLNEVIPYETEYVYNPSKPSTSDPLILEKGDIGFKYTYDGINYKIIKEPKKEVVELGSGLEGTYSGTLTGYGPDCPGCSLVGNVACSTRDGGTHSLINDGIYYNDLTYGDVRIIAADASMFPCGTIIKINNNDFTDVVAVVLDTGYSMISAGSQGNVWIDLAFDSQQSARDGMSTNFNTKFEVQRWGW